MVCPKCGSENVVITVEQTSAKTKGKGMGCLWSMCRIFLIICTCGLWLLVGKRKSKEKTKFKNQTVGICQSCGNKFEIKQ